MSNRSIRAKIARETLQILEGGFYFNSKKNKVSIKEDLNYAIKNSIHYKPSMFDKVGSERERIVNNWDQDFKTKFEVNNETTLTSAHRLIKRENMENCVCLNFASAKNPGGGFLKGSGAQEESLARASGLYSCIAQKKVYYESNKKHRSSLYTDNMIYSPKIPVFRKDNGDFLDAPYLLSIITAPAVNAGAVRKNEPQSISQIELVMKNRIEKVLSLALIHRARALILGAWGCGVFKNKARDVANYFREQLFDNQNFRNKFRTVVFAVLDRSRDKSTLNAFKKAFKTM